MKQTGTTSEDTIRTLKSILKGFGWDSRKSEWTGSMKTRNELEKLVEQGIIRKIKNHSQDKHGAYGISITNPDEVKKLKEFLQEQ